MYAGELDATALGKYWCYVKPYRYAGEDRTRVVCIGPIVEVLHRQILESATTMLYCRDTGGWTYISPLLEGEVTDNAYSKTGK